MAKRKAKSTKSPTPEAQPRRDWRYWVRLITGDNVSGLVKLLIAFLVFSWLVVQQFSIPSGSMEPTLHGDPRFLRGDRVLVNKWLYGPRIPFTNSRIFDYKDPKRWEIVVFNAAQENAEHGVLIKRVVGLPGEHVLIGDDGRIVVNGEPVDPPPELRDVLHYTRRLMPSQQDSEDFLFKLALQDIPPVQLRTLPPVIRQDLDVIRGRLESMSLTGMDEFREISDETRAALLEGVSADTRDFARVELDMLYQEQVSKQKPFRYGIVDEPQYTVVPEGSVFVLGDNSGNSVDGRFFGWLPKGHILGRASCIWWPVTRARDFTGWTSTWWGRAIIYGIPALWIAYEVCIAFFFFSWRIRRETIESIKAGDRVIVNRIALGFRLPFTNHRISKGRSLSPGDVVLARILKANPDGFALARVDSPGSSDGEIVLETQGEYAGSHRVPAGHLIGVVSSVWWPLKRRGRIDAASPATDE